MATRVVEGKKPYTGGKAIDIDENKVISLRLREENNLIIWDEGDNEIYVDLQLADGVKPLDAFPVGVNVGRVLIADDWDVNGTLVVFKTTSGDNIKLLYGDDGKLYIDNGTGLFKQIYLKGEVDALLQALRDYVDAQLALKQDKLIAGEYIEIEDNVISAVIPTISRFLSIWNASSGEPVSFPASIPFTYATGDYYLIEGVGASTNYRPAPVEYDGTASQIPEPDTEVADGDVYIYDGTVWLLQENHNKTVVFQNIAGDPYDNTNLATALNAKANTTDVLTKTNTTSYTPSGNYNPATKKYVDDGLSNKQATLVSGTNIKSINNNSLLGSGNLSIEEVPSGGTNGQVLTQTQNGPDWQNPTGGGDVYVSSQANNIFTTGMKIWGGTSTNYQSLTPDSNTAYLILADQPTPPSPTIELLLVGGGGAGGSAYGGGGGAGGVIHQTDYNITSGTYPISIGAGGIGYHGVYNTPTPATAQGGNTTFLGLTAYGGGAGGHMGDAEVRDGQAGGSGGGGSGWGGSSNGGTATTGQGYNGGNGYSASGAAGQGGGGGAGSNGTDASSNRGYDGGDGIVNPISGSTAGELINGEYWIAGGGGGSCGNTSDNTQGSGGKGGGGDGAALYQTGSGEDGTTYGAGGGGGGRHDTPTTMAGAGYQGIVIIKYKTGDLTATGGTVTTYGDYTIHTFTSDGNFVVS